MTIICGINGNSHDGCVAVLDNDRLLFSLEMEKFGHQRYAPLTTWQEVRDLLRTEGLSFTDVDEFVIDGTLPGIRTTFGKAERTSPYQDRAGGDILSEPTREYDGIPVATISHAAQHVWGGIMSAPWAADRPCWVIVWDGGMPATLYRHDGRIVRRVAVLGHITGYDYGRFAARLEPFKHLAPFFETRPGEFDDVPDEEVIAARLSVPGKAMAYAGLGKPWRLAETLDWAFMDDLYGSPPRADGASDADLMATFQTGAIAQVLLNLRKHVEPNTGPLVFVGGCALNIKWNAALRACGLFPDVWVPPFTNDSGVAIGLAAARLRQRDPSIDRIEWDVYSGPPLGHATPIGWQPRAMTPRQLGAHLHVTDEPIVVLHGRAELGPRALGHRSILAPPTPGMTQRLNRIKGRESYRPIAPMCLVDYAPRFFSPGIEDPYMLFEHRVLRPELIPAVVHVDGSARLQTVHPHEPVLGDVLDGYRQASSIPVLCNTSANEPGRGFFRSPAEACRWAEEVGVTGVWADGQLWTQEQR